MKTPHSNAPAPAEAIFQSPDDIIRENERRLAIINKPYDPIAGNPADPNRFYFDVKGMEAWLPKQMQGDPLVRDLIHCGSLSDYLLTLKGTHAEEARRAVTDRFTRLRCLHDFPFWAASFAYIKVKGGGDDVLFVLNRPQRKLVATLEKMRRAGRPIRLVLLKARQWGGSTCLQLYMAWLQLVHEKGLNSLIIAQQTSATEEIKDMFDRMLSHYPAAMLHEPGEEADEKEKPMKGVGSSGASFRVVARNCKVKVGTAERPDASRSGDYNLVHCSEVAMWRTTRRKTPEDIVRSACSGVLYRPLTMIVYESTANGTENFFHNEYQAAKKGVSQFAALFVAWYEIEQNSLPFADEAERLRFATRLLEGRHAEQATAPRAQPGRYLWWLWQLGATLEAIHWFVMERAKFSDHDLMASECPSDDVEAFVHSGANVFDKYKVDELKRGCGLVARRGEIDGDAPSGPDSLRNVRFNAGEHGALQMWKDRESTPGVKITDRYLSVVDIGGRSEKSDWSVIVVFDREPLLRGGKPEVVAQWRGHVDFDLLAWNAARIAAYYDNALLVIESNTLETADPERSGESGQSSFLLNRLRDAYPNLYARRRSEEEVRQGAPVRYGFHTNPATKPLVISMLIQAIREGMYVERDSGCISEFLAYEQRENGSYAATRGNHDDMLMTRAIGLHICFREMPLPRLVQTGGAATPASRRPVSAAVF